MVQDFKYRDFAANKIVISIIIFIILLLPITIHAISRPTADGFNVYNGNLQNRLNVPDGEGIPVEAYIYVKDVTPLDYYGLSGHANLMIAAESLLIKTTANLYNENYLCDAFNYATWLINVKCLKYKLILVFSSFQFLVTL